MEWGFVLGLGAITLFVIGLVIFFGRKLNKAVTRHAPESSLFSLHITVAGTSLWACVVSFWIICLVAGQIRPESNFGAFVGTIDGVASVFVGSILFVGIVSVILEKLGYPIATKGNS